MELVTLTAVSVVVPTLLIPMSYRIESPADTPRTASASTNVWVTTSERACVLRSTTVALALAVFVPPDRSVPVALKKGKKGYHATETIRVSEN